jgi:hypothetical protein
MLFQFYTAPPLKVYMPSDEVKEYDSRCYFDRAQQVLRAGGFHTCDLG